MNEVYCKLCIDHFLIRGGVLEHLPSLVSLDLGLNLLSSLEMNVFIGNRRLEILALDQNRVIIRTECVCGPFLKLQFEKKTYLQFWIFLMMLRTLIRPSTFCQEANWTNSHHLKSVRLANLIFWCIIQFLWPPIYILESLSILYLLIIQIRQVPEAALGRCQRLTSLDLSHNNLSALASASFSSVPQLEALNLSSCGLASLAPGSLDNLQALTSLDLGYNQLHEAWRNILPRNPFLVGFWKLFFCW